jgi:hypothetical protein
MTAAKKKRANLSASPARLEVHTHLYISGRYAGGAYVPGVWPLERRKSVTHSHENGSTAHQHEDTGPASYTIDKDQWFRATGLRGGGRKKFTAKPTGLQLPRVELEDWQKSFTVIVDEESCRRMTADGTIGGAEAAAARMILQCGMTPHFPQLSES